MKPWRVFLWVVLFVAAGILFLLRERVPKQDGLKVPGRITAIVPDLANDNPPISFPKKNIFPSDDRPEVQTFYKFAEAANLYNFDSTITSFSTNSAPLEIMIGTLTHGAAIALGNIIPGKLTFVASYFEGSDDRRKPEVADLWYQYAGTWTEAEAVAETYEILRKMGENELLASLQTVNKHEFRNEKFRFFAVFGGINAPVVPSRPHPAGIPKIRRGVSGVAPTESRQHLLHPEGARTHAQSRSLAPFQGAFLS